MVQLDYRTNNRRWGLSGIVFTDWNSYGFILGFLSNVLHYNGCGLNSGTWNNTVSIKIERNDLQGADGKEGRIHWYKADLDLQHFSPDLYSCKSAGTGNITYRINSNGYVLSLISDFGFVAQGSVFIDVTPPQNAYTVVRSALSNALQFQNIPNNIIGNCLSSFDNGWNL